MKKMFVLLLMLSFLSNCKEEANCVENLENTCACDYVYNPVCGCNGKTYGNPCVAECAGITEYTFGTCGS